VACRGGEGLRESVLFIGTQFSILYTSMYSPAEAATVGCCCRVGSAGRILTVGSYDDLLFVLAETTNSRTSVDHSEPPQSPGGLWMLYQSALGQVSM
jgi:hypothetical protein